MPVISFLAALQIWDTFFFQRYLALRPPLYSYLFYDPPDFSPWGYLIAGLPSLLFLILPYLACRSHFQRICGKDPR